MNPGDVYHERMRMYKISMLGTVTELCTVLLLEVTQLSRTGDPCEFRALVTTPTGRTWVSDHFRFDPDLDTELVKIA